MRHVAPLNKEKGRRFKVAEMIEYDADNFKERATVPHVPNSVIAYARSLLKEFRLIKLTESVYEYTHQQEPFAGHTERITITDVLKEWLNRTSTWASFSTPASLLPCSGNAYAHSSTLYHTSSVVLNSLAGPLRC